MLVKAGACTPNFAYLEAAQLAQLSLSAHAHMHEVDTVHLERNLARGRHSLECNSSMEKFECTKLIIRLWWIGILKNFIFEC